LAERRFAPGPRPGRGGPLAARRGPGPLAAGGAGAGRGRLGGRRPLGPDVAEAGEGLDVDQLAPLVAVGHVDDPEPPGAELGRLRLAERAEHLRGADDVA